MAIITISQQYGSRGDEIAERVREQLGYRFFDKNLIAQVAPEADLAPGEVVDFSEDDYKARTFLERFFILDNPRIINQVGTWQETDSGAEVEAVMELDEVTAANLVQSVLLAAHRHDNIVILGRGSQAVLRDKPNVLHLRFVAPPEVRARNLQIKENIAPKVAKEMIVQRDKANAEYLKRFYDLDWSDPLLYHLTINTGRWQIEEAVEMTLHAVDQMSKTA